MLSIDHIANKYHGKMVRVVTRKETCLLGFFVGFQHGHLLTFSFSVCKKLVLQRTPVDQVRAVMPSGLLDEQARLCRYIYGNLN